MPGILVMSQPASDAPPALRDGDSKKRDHDGNLVHGNRSDARTELSAGSPTHAIQDQFSQLPPEIAHISTDFYHPLSTLLTRAAQEGYNDLSETLQSMADLPLAPQPNGLPINGLGTKPLAGSQANAKVNEKKKMLMLKFAQENRAKFIKLLVLTEWGKKAAVNVSKLIDLYAWTREQSVHMEAADFAVDSVRRHAGLVGENNPDITTALEILSTAKASWMPNLDYIPPAPLSSHQALQTLRYMNISLSIRLHLHQDLPPSLRSWRIQSGRVTFIVANEFEFDVMSFVQDASDQWYFIDLRFLFSPAPSILPQSRFFSHLQTQADFVLQKKGISGLFDFLTNFALTHKIALLRSQALALIRSGWAGSLKVEPVHRELVVQYWTQRPGKKNWVEIGVSSNKPKNGKLSWRGQPVPSLTLRWFRQGKEVKGVHYKLDWKNVSLERTIKHIIALHTSHILRSTRKSLPSTITLQAHLSDTEPADCILNLHLGARSNSAKLSVEPVTGNYILQPANAPMARAEHIINQGRDPAQIGNILVQTLAQTLLNLIQTSAQQLGWQPVSRQSLNIESMRTTVQLDLLQSALYRPSGWSSSWALAAVIDSTGESWWIFEMGSVGSTVSYAEQIKLNRSHGDSLAINRETLASLEGIAVQLLSLRTTAQELEKEKKSFALRYELDQAGASVGAQPIAQHWALYMDASDLLVTKSQGQPWLESNIIVTCEGFTASGQNVWHIACGRMAEAVVSDMRKLMASSPQPGFHFMEDGRFRILVSTRFGQTILRELRARLQDVNRLRSFAATLQKRQMRLGASSLHRLPFHYGPSPYTAAVKFCGGEKEISIELSSRNPHHRIHKMLTEILNDRLPYFPTMHPADASGLDRFCTTLILTRSLLTILAEMETRTPGNTRNPAIHVHTIFQYRLTYENPVCSFDVRLQPKNDQVYWVVEDDFHTHAHDLRPTPERAQCHRRLDNLIANLKDLFRSRGSGWFGTRNGIVAELDGISDALRRLDQVVLACKMEGGYRPPSPLAWEQPASNKVQRTPNDMAQGNQPSRSKQQAHPQQQQQQQPPTQAMQAHGPASKQQQKQRARTISNGRLQLSQQIGNGVRLGGVGDVADRSAQLKQNIIELD